ncbi:MAG: polysaccharide deacetylase family protein [Polyangiaceae bacterium]
MTRITLSFDNGPDPAVTPRVLDILRDRGLFAHFFVLGKHVATDEGRSLVERIVREGHLVGNHSYTHEIPLGKDTRPDAIEKEIVATDALLTPIVPGEKRFRPFGGGGAIGPHLFRKDVIDHLAAHQYTVVLWNSVPRDWEDPIGWVVRALADATRRDHTVVVLHDIPNACEGGLPAFLDEARARGWQFTLDLPEEHTPLLRGDIIADMGPLTAGGADTNDDDAPDSAPLEDE